MTSTIGIESVVVVYEYVTYSYTTTTDSIPIVHCTIDELLRKKVNEGKWSCEGGGEI